MENTVEKFIHGKMHSYLDIAANALLSMPVQCSLSSLFRYQMMHQSNTKWFVKHLPEVFM